MTSPVARAVAQERYVPNLRAQPARGTFLNQLPPISEITNTSHDNESSLRDRSSHSPVNTSIEAKTDILSQEILQATHSATSRLTPPPSASRPSSTSPSTLYTIPEGQE